jgi:hypothetical protein
MKKLNFRDIESLSYVSIASEWLNKLLLNPTVVAWIQAQHCLRPDSYFPLIFPGKSEQYASFLAFPIPAFGSLVYMCLLHHLTFSSCNLEGFNWKEEWGYCLGESMVRTCHVMGPIKTFSFYCKIPWRVKQVPYYTLSVIVLCFEHELQREVCFIITQSQHVLPLVMD